MKTEFLDKKAVSPVIATVILVSVTIVVAVAVAYWMSGIAGIYTRFEKIEIVGCSTAKADLLEPINDPPVPDSFKITIQLKNTGSADSTVTNVYVNGKVLTDYDPPITTNLGPDGITIPAGKTGENLEIYIQFGVFTSGTTIELKLHTAAGMDYPKLETLP